MPDAPAGKVPAALIDPDKTYFGTKLITTGIVYQHQPGEGAAEILEGSAGAASRGEDHHGASALFRRCGHPYRHDGAAEGVRLALFREAGRGGAIAAKGNGAVIEAVARGEKAYGVIIEYMAFNAKGKGSPVDFVFPEEGVSAITQPVAILKTARNVEAAKAFVDWQLSEEAQRQSVEPGLFPDLRRHRAAEGLSAGLVAEDHAGDLRDMLAHDEDNKKRFTELFGG